MMTIEQKEQITKILSRIHRKLDKGKRITKLQLQCRDYFAEDLAKILELCKKDVDKLKQYLMEIDRKVKEELDK